MAHTQLSKGAAEGRRRRRSERAPASKAKP
eukprot:COSAG06_NODE_64755_length_258_cov_1.635220_1_plen_29_part_01